MKQILLIGLATLGMAADQPALTADQERDLLKLQLQYTNMALELEKLTAPLRFEMDRMSDPLRAKMNEVQKQWKDAEAQIRKALKLPDHCILTPERTWKCEAPTPAAKKTSWLRWPWKRFQTARQS